MKSNKLQSDISSSSKNNSSNDDITVNCGEEELEVIFPKHRVKEAVKRWENEIRMSKMSTIDLEGPTTVIESFQDEFISCGHDRSGRSNKRRPDPPSKDDEDLATRQPLLHHGIALHCESAQSSHPEPQTIRRPLCEWLEPLPTLPSETPPSSRHRQRCRLLFSRPLFIVVSLGCLIMAVKLPAWIQEQNQSAEQKLLHFVDFLASHGISAREDLERYQSPQYRAAAWTVRWRSHEDALIRYVLAVLYYSLNGEAWPIPFLSDRPVCEWYTRINQTVLGVTSCQGQNSTKVAPPTGITLDFKGVSGMLPSEIRYLTTLEHLQIDNNLALGGSLPTSIRHLIHLRSLSLQNCSIGGTLPTWLGELTQLRELMLSDNQLRGPIPSEMVQLTNLHRLSLKGNLLSSQLESLSPLSNLQYLYLQDNLLHGRLLDSMVTNWKKLTEMDLSENQLSGNLPQSLFTHATLQRIDLHDNRFTGTIPSLLAPNNVLTSIRLSSNELGGTIPPSISQLLAIQNLDVNNNILTGTLPESLSAMLNLTVVRMGDNDYTPHPFPKCLLQLSNLRKLSLFRTSLTGSIPDSIGFLSQLHYLDLSENSLRGSLPDTLGYLSILRHLSLRNNLLTGTLPDSSKNWIELDELYLERNFLTGTAQVVCARAAGDLQHFSSDCSMNSMFSCTCCTTCCGFITSDHGRTVRSNASSCIPNKS